MGVGLLLNIFCSVVSCNPTFLLPQIHEKDVSQVFEQSFKLTPIAELIHGGQVEGYHMRTLGNRPIYAFEGIPYAEPPTGHLRFRSAIPKAAWFGVHHAKKPSPACLQLNASPKHLRVLGKENCLFLNVYTPQIPHIDEKGEQVYFEPLPVIVWIHGGSYYQGAGNDIGPAYLLDKDVLLVTINYRLGVLGFLSTGDHASPGNYGLKDQALALKWVHENIERFGGDPHRVTIIGQSAGAAATHLHLISNKTTDYFSSGVSLSGSAFTHWAIKSPDQSKRLTNTLAELVDCRSEDNEAMVDCLREMNPAELVSAQIKLMDFVPFPPTLFSPVLEAQGPDAFLTKKPAVAYRKGLVQPKSWIFGMTAEEGYLGLLYLKGYFTEKILRSNWEELSPTFLDYEYTAHNVTKITRILKRLYFGRSTPATVHESKIAAMFGDRFFLPGLHKSVKAHSYIAPTFAYNFGYKGKYNVANSIGKKSFEWGVGHMEDLYYYFNSSSAYTGFQINDKDEIALSKIMTGILANFATKGDPLVTQPNKISVRLWEPVHPKEIRFLKISKNIKMVPEPYRERIKFWKKIEEIDPVLVNPLYGL